MRINHHLLLRTIAGFISTMVTFAAIASNTVAPTGYKGYLGDIYSTADQVCDEFYKQGSYTSNGRPYWDDFSKQLVCPYKDAQGYKSTFTNEVQCPDNSSPVELKKCLCWGEKVASGNTCVDPDEAKADNHESAAVKLQTNSAPVEPTPEIAARMLQEGSLTDMANEVKKLGPQSGVAIEIALARLPDRRKILVAGINSGSNIQWTDAQLAQLSAWKVNVAPNSVSKTLLGKVDGGALHAEENIAAYMQRVGAQGERWSIAVVGDVKRAGKAYVCERCRSIIASVGGRIEERGPKLAPPQIDSSKLPKRPPGK